MGQGLMGMGMSGGLGWPHQLCTAGGACGCRRGRHTPVSRRAARPADLCLVRQACLLASLTGGSGVGWGGVASSHGSLALGRGRGAGQRRLQ